jgi:hypothetical protein
VEVLTLPPRRLLIYELRAQDASGGKLLAPEELWYVTESAAHTLRPPGPRGNASLAAPVADSRVAELTEVLQNYMQRHRDPIDVHTGIFAPHIVVIPEVRHLPARMPAVMSYTDMCVRKCTRARVLGCSQITAFLNEGYAAAYPHSMHMSTVDSAVLVYSIFVVCLAVLYHSLEHKMHVGKDYDPEMPVTHDMLTGDLLIFDALFWLTACMVVALFLHMTTAVAQPPLFAGMAVVYVFALYTATAPGAPRTVQLPAVALWLASVVACKAVSSNGLFNGFLFILVDVFSAIFAYVCLCEEHASLAKYLNARFWAAILHNGCLLFAYVSSVVFLVPPQPAYQSSQAVHAALAAQN